MSLETVNLVVYTEDGANDLSKEHLERVRNITNAECIDVIAKRAAYLYSYAFGAKVNQNGGCDILLVDELGRHILNSLNTGIEPSLAIINIDGEINE